MARRARAAQGCITQLRQALDLASALSPEDYAFCGQSGSPAGGRPEDEIWSSPGAHIRHILDYVDCIFAGLDARTIDYTERKRRIEVEQSPSIGAREIMRCIESLETIAALDERIPLEVRTDAGEAWTASTLGRELQFVSGHAIHHYALIRLTLARRGIAAPDAFGVSASTVEHWAARRESTD